MRMDHTGVRHILASEPAGGKAHHASAQLTGKRGEGPKRVYLFSSFSNCGFNYYDVFNVCWNVMFFIVSLLGSA